MTLIFVIDSTHTPAIPLFLVSVWLEIKRRSQVFKNRSRACPNLSRSDSGSSYSNNLHYHSGGANLDTRPGYEHDEAGSEHYDNNVESKSDNVLTRSPGEHEDTGATCVLRDSGNFDEDAYSTIDIDDNDKDKLLMKFEIRQSGKSLDRNYMQKSLMSHRKVKEFLADEGNDFDVCIYDWEYQRKSNYSYTSGEGMPLKLLLVILILIITTTCPGFSLV